MSFKNPSSPSANTAAPIQRPTAPTSSYKSIAFVVALLAITLAFLTPLRASVSRVFYSAPQTVRRAAMSTATSTAIMSNETSASGSNVRVQKRPWNLRGVADHGWLYTFHTFSFADYYSPEFESFGPLRVINEDRVERGTGFGTHAHREFLIWSYIVKGEMEHKDSMGNLETLKRGEVQFTSAGTGIRHSEYNRNPQLDAHFLQIWAKPYKSGLQPSYKTRNFPEELKRNKLCRIMEDVSRHSGKDEEGEPIPLHADLSMSASILEPGHKVEHEIVKDGKRNIYLHVVMTGKTQPKTGGMKIKMGNVVIGEGDGAFVRGAEGPGKIEVESVGDKPAEFVLFDMGTN
ncbi:hypothetical protein AAFC00_002351 [Neodothiora populina]|uniref:RmlC-like cupin n=1 Tax=Neodothiora populina TaxID=2781224 RepID=A0ABR3PH54_9PEZI